MDRVKARALFFTSMGHFFNDGSAVLMPIVVDLLAVLRGVTLTEEFVLLSAYYGCSTVSSLAVGNWADRSGRAGPLVGVGVALVSSGLIGFYLIFEYAGGALLFASATAAALVMGFGSAFYHPLGASVLQSAFERGRGRALGVNGALGSLSRSVYPTLLIVAAVYLTEPGSLAFLGLVGAGAGLVIWVGLRKVRGPARTGSPGTGAGSAVTLTLVSVTAVTFFRSVTLQSIAASVPTYLTFNKGTGTGFQFAFTLTIMYAAAILGQPVFGMLIDKFDHRKVLALSTAGGSLSILGYTQFGGYAGLVLLSAFGFFTFNGFPILLSLAADYTRKGSASFGNAMVWGIGSTGGNAVGPLVIAALTLNESARLDFAFEVLVAVALVTAVVALLLPRPTEEGAHRTYTVRDPSVDAERGS